MIHITNLSTGLKLFKALDSPVRIQILELLDKHNGLNMNEIAKSLNLSNGTVTMHIKKLEESGLVKTASNYAKNGLQKNCYLSETNISIEITTPVTENVYESEIGVGNYTNFEITKTCGMATKDRIIGEFDNPQIFADPLHTEADIIWFTSGFVEYWIPNYTNDKTIKEIQISFEIGSEAPYYNDNWPSTINFYLNDKHVGFWEAPGDIGGMKYTKNPIWWPPHLNQYGFLKLLRINNDGSFIDGRKISGTTVNEIFASASSKPLVFKMEVEPINGEYHGLTIFGKNFGRYDQDILARIITY